MVRMQKVWLAILVAAVAGGAGAAALPSTAIAAGKCDGKAKPCPLQQFMRDNAGTPMADGDLAKVAKAMEKTQKYGGPNMTDWAKLRQEGGRRRQGQQDGRPEGRLQNVPRRLQGCLSSTNETLRNKPLP